MPAILLKFGGISFQWAGLGGQQTHALVHPAYECHLIPSPLEKAVLELPGQLCWGMFTVVDGRRWVLILLCGSDGDIKAVIPKMYGVIRLGNPDSF